MMGSVKKERFEDIAIIGGLIGMQAMYAGNSVLLSYLMAIGFQPDTLIFLSSFATFVILAPLSCTFERSQWPKKIKMKLWIELLLISFGGVTLFQSLLLKGINLTSPAMATAMPNLAPGFIFFIAWACRLEKVELGCMYSRAKITGTLLCVIGAIIMSLMQSTFNIHSKNPDDSQYTIPPPSPAPHDPEFDHQKIEGAMYLIAAVFVLSSNTVLQAAALTEFPVPISLCATTSLIGGIFAMVIQLIQKRRIDFGWPILSIGDLVVYPILVYTYDYDFFSGHPTKSIITLKGLITGLCVTFNIWAMKKRGPVLVSVFSPIGTLISVVLSVNTIQSSISLGSLAGMFIMFSGLYFVLWAKGKERIPTNNGDSIIIQDEYDVEKPLLS